jgi:hypothetical protein
MHGINVISTGHTATGDGMAESTKDSCGIKLRRK